MRAARELPTDNASNERLRAEVLCWLITSPLARSWLVAALEDVQEAAFVVGRVVGEVCSTSLTVLGQEVQAIPKLVELLAGDDPARPR